MPSENFSVAHFLNNVASSSLRMRQSDQLRSFTATLARLSLVDLRILILSKAWTPKPNLFFPFTATFNFKVLLLYFGVSVFHLKRYEYPSCALLTLLCFFHKAEAVHCKRNNGATPRGHPKIKSKQNKNGPESPTNLLVH